jgi:hypothetical protein
MNKTQSIAVDKKIIFSLLVQILTYTSTTIFLIQFFRNGNKSEKIDQIIVGVSLTGFACLMFIIALWG